MDHYKNTVYVKFAQQVETRSNCQIPIGHTFRKRNVNHNDNSCVQLQMY